MNILKLKCIFWVTALTMTTGICAQNIKFELNNFPDSENDLKNALSAIDQGEKFLFEAETMLLGKGIDIRHKAKAMDMISKGLEFFLQANAFNPQSARLNYTIGKSYLYIGDYEQALTFLRKAILLDEKAFKDVYFLIGQVHQQTGALESAIEAYNIAARNYGNEDEWSRIIGSKIKECKYAQELMSDAVDVLVENMGVAANTANPEYLPIIMGGDEMLFFERFSGGRNKLYAAERTSGGWKAAVETNQMFSLPEKGKGVLTELTLVDKNGVPAISRWFAINTGSQQQVNPGSYELLAASSKSQDKPMAFFSSNRYEGAGGFDIFISQSKKNGQWERPRNFSEINTEKDEYGVVLHPSGEALYFSSNGYQTMGGYDIFKTEYDGRHWSEPENLGYPINSTADDIVYSISEDGNRLYFSSNRVSGKGGYDIYLVNFMPDVIPARKSEMPPVNISAEAIGIISAGEPSAAAEAPVIPARVTPSGVAKYPAALNGFISDTQTYLPLNNVALRLLDKSNNTEEVIETDGKGVFYATLSAGGSYRIAVDAPGYHSYVEDFKVNEEVGQKLSKNIGLLPLLDGSASASANVVASVLPEQQTATAESEEENEDIVVLAPIVADDESQQQLSQVRREYPVAVTGLITDNETFASIKARITVKLKNSNDDEHVFESNNKGLVNFYLASGNEYEITVTAPNYESYTEELVTADAPGQKLSKTIQMQAASPVTVAEVIQEPKPLNLFEEEVFVQEEPVVTAPIVELAPVPVLVEEPEPAVVAEVVPEPEVEVEMEEVQPAPEPEQESETLYEEDIVVLPPVLPLTDEDEAAAENREYPVNLKLYVSDSQTLRPLAVSVRLTVEGTDMDNALKTDEKGMLDMTIASGNTYRLAVEYEGYTSAEEEFDVAKGPGQFLTRNILLTSLAPAVTPETIVAEVIEIEEVPVVIPEEETSVEETPVEEISIVEEEPVVAAMPEPEEEVQVQPEPELESVVAAEPEIEIEPVVVLVEETPEEISVIEEISIVEETPVVTAIPEPVVEEVVEETARPEEVETGTPATEIPVVETPVVEKADVESAPPVVIALSGTIVSANTKKPVTTATVTLTDATRGITEVIKASEGKFTVNTLAGSNYSVKVTAEGYQTEVRDMETSSKDKKINLPVELYPVTETFVINVYFDFDRAALNDKAEQTLQDAIALLKQGKTISLIGYTDNVGGEGYNKRLSERRAEAVSTYLRVHGIAPDDIRISWKGFSNPVETNLTTSGRKLNNRVEIWTK